jgi:hypothetical protein
MAEGQGNNRRDSDTAAASFAFSALTISLPKGGGAIRGAGETFLGEPVHWLYERAGYCTAALPLVEFTYSKASIDKAASDVALAALPEGLTALTSSGWTWRGRHLTGVLGEAAKGWFYLGVNCISFDPVSKASDGWLHPVRLVRGLDPRPTSPG